MAGAVEQPTRTTNRPDRNLALDLVRVTEAAALAAGRWIGRGDKNSADQAAVDAMRGMFDTVHMNGVVVIGEGSSTELNALAAVRRLRVPLLVLGSRDDRYLDAADARKLVRAATHTHATLVEFDGSVHGWDLLSFTPQKTRADRDLVAFLRRVTQ